MQLVTAREGPGQSEPSPLAPDPTLLRTASQVAQEKTLDWEAPQPKRAGPIYGARPQQPTSPPPAPQSAQRAAEAVRGVTTGVGQQFRGDRVRQALLAGLQGFQRSRYFREAGLGEALKYSLNPQGYRPRPVVRVTGRPGVAGLDPQNVQVTEHRQPW
jgi:hypothetical protein